MSFRRRPFPEVLDNLLTDIAGGVAAETHPFPPPDASSPPFQFNLEQPPVAQVVSVYGSRDGRAHLFRADVDYKLLNDKQTLQWLDGAELPDPGTLVTVNYFPQSALPVLTDLQTGSIVRTLSESIALEIAGLYAQLDAVYQAGFIDTAGGPALDKVVALLGIERVSGGRATGEIQFTRAPGSRGIITIPAGTRILTADGNVEYATTETVTLAESQTTIRIPARDLERNAPLAADTLTVLAVPIAGIQNVTNPAPTAIATRNETDAELRTRARHFLHGSERATLGALRQAIARQQISADVEEDPARPGRVTVTPHTDTLPPELQQRLLKAIEDTRPAGVVVKLAGAVPPRRVNLDVLLTTGTGLTEQALRAAQRAVRSKIEDYFQRLPAREPGSINRLVGSILSIAEVKDVRLLSATVEGEATERLDPTTGIIDIGGFPTVLGELRIADPNLPTVLNVVVGFPKAEAPPDRPQIEAALSEALAYLNTLNSTELAADAPTAEQNKRKIGFGKLLRATPLPGKPAESLESFDEAVGPTPTLPDETDIAPYTVQFAFIQESGLSQLLEKATDSPYTLTPFERMILGEITVTELNGG